MSKPRDERAFPELHPDAPVDPALVHGPLVHQPHDYDDIPDPYAALREIAAPVPKLELDDHLVIAQAFNAVRQAPPPVLYRDFAAAIADGSEARALHQLAASSRQPVLGEDHGVEKGFDDLMELTRADEVQLDGIGAKRLLRKADDPSLEGMIAQQHRREEHAQNGPGFHTKNSKKRRDEAGAVYTPPKRTSYRVNTQPAKRPATYPTGSWNAFSKVENVATRRLETILYHNKGVYRSNQSTPVPEDQGVIASNRWTPLILDYLPAEQAGQAQLGTIDTPSGEHPPVVVRYAFDEPTSVFPVIQPEQRVGNMQLPILTLSGVMRVPPEQQGNPLETIDQIGSLLPPGMSPDIFFSPSGEQALVSVDFNSVTARPQPSNTESPPIADVMIAPHDNHITRWQRKVIDICDQQLQEERNIDARTALLQNRQNAISRLNTELQRIATGESQSTEEPSTPTYEPGRYPADIITVVPHDNVETRRQRTLITLWDKDLAEATNPDEIASAWSRRRIAVSSLNAELQRIATGESQPELQSQQLDTSAVYARERIEAAEALGQDPDPFDLMELTFAGMTLRTLLEGDRITPAHATAAHDSSDQPRALSDINLRFFY